MSLTGSAGGDGLLDHQDVHRLGGGHGPLVGALGVEDDEEGAHNRQRNRSRSCHQARLHFYSWLRCGCDASEGEADDGGAVFVDGSERVAVGEGDVLDEAADDSAAVALAFGRCGDAGGRRLFAAEFVGEAAVSAELPAGDFECGKGDQAVDGARSGSGDFVEDRQQDDDFPACGDFGAPAVELGGAVSRGVVAGVAAAFADCRGRWCPRICRRPVPASRSRLPPPRRRARSCSPGWRCCRGPGGAALRRPRCP